MHIYGITPLGLYQGLVYTIDNMAPAASLTEGLLNANYINPLSTHPFCIHGIQIIDVSL